MSDVNNYAENVVTRTCEPGVLAGREFASAADGTARANAVEDRIAALNAAEQIGVRARVARGRRRRPAQRASRIALFGLLVCIARADARHVLCRTPDHRPVTRLAAAADRVRRGELDVAVPVSGRGEIVRLGEAFNAMAISLQESRDELEQPEHRARDAGDRARGAPRGADGVQRRGARATRRAVGRPPRNWRRRSGARRATGRSRTPWPPSARRACWRGSPCPGWWRPPVRTSVRSTPPPGAHQERWTRLAAVGLDPATLAESIAAGGEGAGRAGGHAPMTSSCSSPPGCGCRRWPASPRAGGAARAAADRGAFARRRHARRRGVALRVRRG